MEPKKELDTKLLAYFFQKTYHDDKPISLVETEIIPGAQSGDNHGSDVFRVKMKFICGSGKIKRRSIIVKAERNLDHMKDFVQSFPVFRTEVRMYSTVFSLMDDLMEEFDDRREKLWPTMYGFQPYNMIVLEDLKEAQFEIADRRKLLDLPHALLVLRSLARFHAMSKVIIGRGLLTKEDKGSYYHVESGGIIETVWNSLLTVICDGIRDNWGEDWIDLSEKLRSIKKDAGTRMQDLAVNFDSRFEVMSHADVWMCNMMFRYMEGERIPVSVRFIDFQGSYASSFIVDVTNFVFTNVVPSIRRENTDKLLEAYHESLSGNLKFFDYTGYIPTLDDVKSEWKRVNFSHVIFLCTNLLISSEVDDFFDLSKLMTHPPHEVYKITSFANGKAKASISDDFKYYSEIGIF